MIVNELLALSQRWAEAADVRTDYGGEDQTASALQTCASQLEEIVVGLDQSEFNGSGAGFMTVAEVAAWIGGVSPSSVRRWLRTGYFEGAWQLDSGAWRVPRSAAFAYVAKREYKTTRANGKATKNKYNRAEFIKRFSVKEAS